MLAADGVFSSAETAEAWVRQSAAQFPGGAALEALLKKKLLGELKRNMSRI